MQEENQAETPTEAGELLSFLGSSLQPIGGRIICSCYLTHMQIAEAQAKGRWFADRDGLGWVMLPWDLTTNNDEARNLRQRDEARAELAKLEAAHKDLKIDRDQACFERDELVKVLEHLAVGVIYHTNLAVGKAMLDAAGSARNLLARINKQGGAATAASQQPEHVNKKFAQCCLCRAPISDEQQRVIRSVGWAHKFCDDAYRDSIEGGAA